ncbi:MAG: carboxypeptidase-like regulatory domain-containing protein [Candidatus Udaeobacter sp.]
MLATIRYSFALMFLFGCGGCARHYAGRVVDVHGRPVSHARVEGSGMHGGMITGEGPFTVHTVADADGKFTIVTSDWPGDITATSPDSKRHGHVSLATSEPRVVIVIR